MRKTKQIIAGLLLGLLVTANLAQLEAPPSGDARVLVQARVYPLGVIHFKKKQYDEMGTFLGCWGIGSDCMTIPLGDWNLTVSAEGLHTQ